MTKGEKFFTDFQDQMYNKYGYHLDKLNPSQRFWNYNKVSGVKEYRNAPSHNYYLHYAKRFEPIRNKVKKVLEIGVFKGHSMLLWNDYFPQAKIYGIDIDLNQKHLGQNAKDICEGKDRVKLKEFNACSEVKFKEAMAENWFDMENKFDIIIDDGSHHPVHQAQALLMYMPLLADDGIFVIEDIFEKPFWKQVERIEKIFKIFNHKVPEYYFGDFLEKLKTTQLNNISEWGCNINSELKKWWEYNPISEFDIENMKAEKYKVRFEDVDLNESSVEMAFNNALSLTFIKRKK